MYALQNIILQICIVHSVRTLLDLSYICDEIVLSFHRNHFQLLRNCLHCFDASLAFFVRF